MTCFIFRSRSFLRPKAMFRSCRFLMLEWYFVSGVFLMRYAIFRFRCLSDILRHMPFHDPFWYLTSYILSVVFLLHYVICRFRVLSDTLRHISFKAPFWYHTSYFVSGAFLIRYVICRFMCLSDALRYISFQILSDTLHHISFQAPFWYLTSYFWHYVDYRYSFWSFHLDSLPVLAQSRYGEFVHYSKVDSLFYFSRKLTSQYFHHQLHI